MMRNRIEKQFGQAEDLTTTDFRKHEEDGLETCQDEATLNVDDFFELLGDVCDDGTTESDSGKMDTLCVRSNLPLRESLSTQSESQTVSLSDFQALVQKMKAMERKMASDASVLLNQRMKVLEAHMDSDTSVLLYQRVEALEVHLGSDTSVLLNQRVKALETRMASETSTLLGQRVKALETRMDSDTSSSLDRRVKALETKMASGPVPWLNQQLGKLETKIDSKISALMTQGKADQKSISTLKKVHESSQARIQNRLDKITTRLDKMHCRIHKTEGRLDKNEQ